MKTIKAVLKIVSLLIGIIAFSFGISSVIMNEPSIGIAFMIIGAGLLCVFLVQLNKTLKKMKRNNDEPVIYVGKDLEESPVSNETGEKLD